MQNSNIGEFTRTDFIQEFPETVDGVFDVYNRERSEKGLLTMLSSGRNWGFGSYLPSTEGATVVNLSALNKIKEIDLARGVAHIEAGVTQGQLSMALKDTSYFLNVTASSPVTSILGNILEKGLGFYRQRSLDLLGLKIITGFPGKLVTMGGDWRLEPNLSRAFINKCGIGPSATGLFCQSNFGLVVEAAVELLPRPEIISLIKVEFLHQDVPSVFSIIRELYSQAVINAVTRVYSANAYTSTQENSIKSSGFVAYIILHGPFQLQKNKMDYTLKRFTTTTLRTLSDISDAVTPLDKSCFLNAHGDPSANDEMIKHTFGADGLSLDRASSVGWLTLAVFIPNESRSITDILNMVAELDVTQRYCKTTFNIISHNSIDAVISIYFNRSSHEEIQTAHILLSQLHDAVKIRGFRPYRTDIDHPIEASADPWFINALKSVCDPLLQLAKSRYT